MNTYRAKLKHDSGIVFITTKAQSRYAAKQIIMNAENCPERAIISIHDTQFYNKDGSLTAYALACGYLERIESKSHWKELYKEHSHYHVRKGPLNQRWQIWDTFSSNELTKARKRFKQLRLNENQD